MSLPFPFSLFLSWWIDTDTMNDREYVESDSDTDGEKEVEKSEPLVETEAPFEQVIEQQMEGVESM